jgi:hypothetical protein
LTYPREYEGSPGCPQPLIIYPIDPPKEVKIIT